MRGIVCHVAIQQALEVTVSRRRFVREGRSYVFGLEPIVRLWPMCATATCGANAFWTPDSHSAALMAVRHL